jgi:hypothetical protein
MITVSASSIFQTRTIEVTEEDGGVDFIQVINQDLSGFTLQTGEVAFFIVNAYGDAYKETYVMIRPTVTTAVTYGYGETQVSATDFLLLREAATGNEGEANTISSAGGSYSIAKSKNGVDLPVKGLSVGAGITIVDDGAKLTIASSITQAETNTLGSLGSGTSVVGAKDGLEVKNKSLTGDGINFSSDANEVNMHVWGQKTITSDYTVLAADDKKTIFVNAGVNDVDITIPVSLSATFSQAFVQLGTGNVNFLEDGTTILGTKLSIKAQYNQAWMERSPVGSETYVLLGNVEV